ncbi:hypothetical protein IWW48_005270 [Coemansia sp. RSA 1200]|nr:hypothetical protein IWW48_005270 [Coemansia sp. RSA 1200]
MAARLAGVAISDDYDEDRAFLVRSVARCEDQLNNVGFSEPLDAVQIRQLSNIENIIAQYRQMASHQDEDEKKNSLHRDPVAEQFGDCIARIESQIEPWIKKKEAIVASLQSVGQEEKKEDGGDSRATLPAMKTKSGTQMSGALDSSFDGDVNEHWTDELLGEMEGLRRRGVVPNNAGAVERLLQSQRSMHEDLTDDLVKMASVLKKNTLDFGVLMEKDKKVVEEAAEQLEKSAAGVGKHGLRLEKYRKRAWGTTGLTWLAVLVVVSVFFTLVLFIKVAPKRY